MQVLRVRDALGGVWAVNLRGFLFLSGPTALLAWLWDYQRVPFPVWGVLLVSVVAQQIAAGLITLPFARAWRRRTGALPLGAVFAMWAVTGIARGLVGGWFASTFANVRSEYLARTAAWFLVACVWFPLLTYALAQLDHRRRLLAAFAIESSRLDAERERTGRSATELRAQLVSSVQRSIGPVIEEIKASLVAASRELDPESFHAISERLGSVADSAGDLVRDIENDPVTAIEMLPQPTAPISRAIDFDQERPITTAAATFVAIIPLLLPDTYREGGLVEAVDLLGSVACGIVVFAVLMIIVRRWARRMPYVWRMSSVVGTYVLAGVVAAATMYGFTGPVLTQRDLTLILYLPLAFTVAALCVSAAIGLWRVNLQFIGAIADLDHELEQLREVAIATETQVREQLAALMHGPVQGRLSACAMALNFHANETGLDRERTAVLTSTVLQHLAAASADLMLLGSVSQPLPGSTMTHGVSADS